MLETPQVGLAGRSGVPIVPRRQCAQDSIKRQGRQGDGMAACLQVTRTRLDQISTAV